MGEIESRVILTTIIILIALISLNISNKIFLSNNTHTNEKIYISYIVMKNTKKIISSLIILC